MTMQIHCWQCGGELTVGEELVGEAVVCLHCSASVPVPKELLHASNASSTTSNSQGKMNKSPMGAAFLNFFFWGAGYVYLGCMKGLWILLPFCFLLGANTEKTGVRAPSTVTFLLVNFVGLAMATHAYGMAKQARQPGGQ